MSYKLQFESNHAPVEITIAGKTVTASSFEGTNTDQEEKPLFGDVYPTSPDVNGFETEITFHFRGEEALKVRDAITALLKG